MMGEFFKGWRRKIGEMALVIALVFSGGWGLGFYFTDPIEFCRINDNQFYVVSFKQDGIGFAKSQRIDEYIVERGHFIVEDITIPRLPIAGILSLISAYLLLTKPEPTDPNRVTGPTPDGEA
jgi:hypothetical protein